MSTTVKLRHNHPFLIQTVANGALRLDSMLQNGLVPFIVTKENSMKMSMHAARLASCVLVAAMAAGCAQTGGGSTGQRTAIGAGAGAALGAGLGALIGDSSKAAAIGAGVGALAGGVAGYNWQGVKNDVQQSGAASLGVDVVEMPDGSLKVNIPSTVSFDTGQYELKPALLPVLESWEAPRSWLGRASSA